MLNKKFRNGLINILLICLSVAVPLYGAEYIFKKCLFDFKNTAFKKYRDQTLYAADWDENYWKLYKIFTQQESIGRNKLLGWNYPSYFNSNFLHQSVPHLKKRRPALLYGDSFAQCVAGTVPFQDIINADTAFTKNNYFINYGTGAFGVDQIYTLLKNTYYKYENPVVIFSFMTEDLDRSVLQIREGIKPYYTLRNDSLVFNEQPYVGNFYSFIKENPVAIKSFLWRKFLYSNANFLPETNTQHLTGEIANRKKIIPLNKKILEAAVTELRQSNTDFIFLVFNSMGDILMSPEKNWRMQFINDFVKQNKIEAVFTKDLLPPIQQADSAQLYNYFLKNDGHPNTIFNKIISKKITEDILNNAYEKNSTLQRQQYTYTYSHMLDSVCAAIQNNTASNNQVTINAKRDSMSYDEALQKLAMWELFNFYETTSK